MTAAGDPVWTGAIPSGYPARIEQCHKNEVASIARTSGYLRGLGC
jgi:hypothetical protein